MSVQLGLYLYTDDLLLLFICRGGYFKVAYLVLSVGCSTSEAVVWRSFVCAVKGRAVAGTDALVGLAA